MEFTENRLLSIIQKSEEINRQHLEEALQMNAELESFNYSVSHDMRGPITRISGYSQILMESSGLDEEQKKYLQKINRSALQLNEMLDSLLILSKPAKGELVKTTVNISGMAQNIIEDIIATAPDRTLRYEIEPGLLAVGDERLLYILLNNLLANAWRFTSTRRISKIHVGRAKEQEIQPAFFVKDNGIGFDMKDAPRIFMPMNRLNSGKGPCGTGIGLPTAKRVVSRHGGTITAESSPDHGATFIFTLPCSDTADQTTTN